VTKSRRRRLLLAERHVAAAASAVRLAGAPAAVQLVAIGGTVASVHLLSFGAVNLEKLSRGSALASALRLLLQLHGDQVGELLANGDSTTNANTSE
jgi:hypothetical protein